VPEDGGGVGVGGVDVEAGAEVEVEKAGVFEGPRALALRVPKKVIVGSSGFQQFF